VKADEGRLIAEARGEVESDDGVLVLKRIHVTYCLGLDESADRDAVQRAFDHHMQHCPVYRSISPAIDVTTALEVVS
jgi:uncharacterized OsmC-like protein